ncbi:hypothetical protein SKAU_G00024830 [Synaphobranchus kaupii]|uniref:Uncharacterized protein n=1 Tax=Synaphobranchus kaupii TaxID=118154 RepID=A0A9Q1JEA3_SYNKA|nr:hypothetical protein SKAU_G00024830 [Synaphobranchus kaupii]
MATLDRKVPSPDTFQCKPWSAYTDTDVSRCSDNMHLFGQYTAHDDSCLVSCNAYNQVVKPHGSQTHCGWGVVAH